jgi:hypothetical protein
MIGSISKIRPCGHHHYYKYAHATAGRHPNNYDGKKYDMYQVSREYWNDVDEDNCWNFSLENAKSLTYCCFELGRFIKFKSKTPKLTNALYMFTTDNGLTSPPITELEMDFDNLTNVDALFYGMQLKNIPKGFNPKTRSFFLLFSSGTASSISKNNTIFPFNEVINEVENGTYLFIRNSFTISDDYTFENVKNASCMFSGNGYYDTVKNIPKKLSFKNVENFYNAFAKCENLTYFQTVDEMSKMTSATYTFTGCKKLSALYPDYESFSWPKLSSATYMFNGCILDKPSILKLSNALPNWGNDTAAHNITIGCHIDHKYDPEVNVALKKLQSSYTTPIEELGGSLSETVTTDKGWTITVQWNGTATANAYPAPTV